MAYINVELDEFDDQDLIEELHSRGYYVGDNEDDALTNDERDIILDLLVRAKPGTAEYDIYEKLRKR